MRPSSPQGQLESSARPAGTINARTPRQKLCNCSPACPPPLRLAAARQPAAAPSSMRPSVCALNVASTPRNPVFLLLCTPSGPCGLAPCGRFMAPKRAADVPWPPGPLFSVPLVRLVHSPFPGASSTGQPLGGAQPTLSRTSGVINKSLSLSPPHMRVVLPGPPRYSPTWGWVGGGAPYWRCVALAWVSGWSGWVWVLKMLVTTCGGCWEGTDGGAGEGARAHVRPHWRASTSCAADAAGKHQYISPCSATTAFHPYNIGSIRL